LEKGKKGQNYSGLRPDEQAFLDPPPKIMENLVGPDKQG
jgi:hypothetical protein